MRKILYDANEVVVYSYDIFIGKIILAQARDISIGDEIEIDFDDSTIGFEEGAWKRPTGLFGFCVDFFDDLWDIAIVQLAMYDVDDDEWSSGDRRMKDRYGPAQTQLKLFVL